MTRLTFPRVVAVLLAVSWLVLAVALVGGAVGWWPL